MTTKSAGAVHSLSPSGARDRAAPICESALLRALHRAQRAVVAAAAEAVIVPAGLKQSEYDLLLALQPAPGLSMGAAARRLARRH